MSNLILRNDTDNGVTRLVLNSDHNLNALSDGMLADLAAELDAIAENPRIRAVIIAGHGRAFCAGHDLKEITARRADADNGREAFADLFSRCSAVMQRLQKMPQPVIAEVHGIAAAAGCQLVASCDMAVAADDTRFGVNGVNIGLFCSTPMVALSRNIPRKKAFELLTTGEFLTAEEAKKYGLINRVCGREDLGQQTMELAGLVASKQASAVKIGKEAFYQQLELTVGDAYAYTSKVITENLLYKDTEAAISAFLNRK